MATPSRTEVSMSYEGSRHRAGLLSAGMIRRLFERRIVFKKGNKQKDVDQILEIAYTLIIRTIIILRSYIIPGPSHHQKPHWHKDIITQTDNKGRGPSVCYVYFFYSFLWLVRIIHHPEASTSRRTMQDMKLFFLYLQYIFFYF